MADELGGAAQHRKGERLLGQLDAMVRRGWLTEGEANRLRAGVDSGGLDHIALELRVTHARARLDAAVRDATLTRAEADAILLRLQHGEHPRLLRDRGLRRKEQPLPDGGHPARQHTEALAERGHAHG